MNRKQKIIVSVTGIFLVLLILMGLTYAYFLTRINGNSNNTSISVTTANLVLDYADGNGMLLPYGTIQPGDPIKFYTAKVGEDGKYLTDEQGNYIPDQVVESKTFSVTNNGNASVNYAVILDNFGVYYASDATYDGTSVTKGDSTNFVFPEDFELEITCISNKDSCMGQSTTLPTTNTRLLTNDIGVGETQEYTLTMTYVDSGIDQSADMNKTFTGRINIIDIKNTVDIEGKIANYTPGDYIETNSVRRTSNIDSNGNYKILGLEPDTHTFKVMSKAGVAKVTKTLNITKGTSSSINGTDIVSTSNARTFEINVGSNNEIEIIEKIDKNSLTGVTVSVLKATHEENQVDGLVLYEKFSDAYNALKAYFEVQGGMTDYAVAKVKYPEELTWTIYGSVDASDYASMPDMLTGGVNTVIYSRVGEKLTHINLLGGNDSAELISNHSGNVYQSFITYAYNYTDLAENGGVEVPIELVIKNIKFPDDAIISDIAPANITVENCMFEDYYRIRPSGNVLIKNNRFIYNEENYDQGHYAIYVDVTVIEENDTKVEIINNIVNGSPRGINIDTKSSDVIVKGNYISNITLGRGAIQLTKNDTVLIENNKIFDIDGNALFFHDTYISNGITIKNNTINTKYLAVFGDDVDTLDIPSTIQTVTSSGNTVNVINPGKGITKQGTIQENGFTLN